MRYDYINRTFSTVINLRCTFVLEYTQDKQSRSPSTYKKSVKVTFLPYHVTVTWSHKPKIATISRI